MGGPSFSEGNKFRGSLFIEKLGGSIFSVRANCTQEITTPPHVKSACRTCHKTNHLADGASLWAFKPKGPRG